MLQRFALLPANITYSNLTNPASHKLHHPKVEEKLFPHLSKQIRERKKKGEIRKEERQASLFQPIPQTMSNLPTALPLNLPLPLAQNLAPSPTPPLQQSP